MNLVKTSFYTSISTAITFISGFIVTKVVAVQIGPAGMAYVGQFQNITFIILMFATAALGVGVVKYLAQYSGDPQKQKTVISTVFRVVFISSLAVALFTVLFAKYLSVKIFKSPDYTVVFWVYAIFIFVLAINLLFASIFNGLKEIKKLTISSILSSLVSILFTVSMAYTFHVKGVLLAGSFSGFVILFINLYIFTGGKFNELKNYLHGFDAGIFRLLLSFTLMSIITTLLTPVAQVVIRDKIITDYGPDMAGNWQAVTKISDYYLSFVTSVLGVYYMPKLSELTDKRLLRKEILSGYMKIIPVVILMAFIIWLFRDLIIHILFTKEFLPMKPFFTFQLLGDVFKLGSWLLAYLMLAKTMTRAYIFSEVFFTLLSITLNFFLINKAGVIGASYAFCLTYLVYWICIGFIVKKQLY